MKRTLVQSKWFWEIEREPRCHPPSCRASMLFSNIRRHFPFSVTIEEKNPNKLIFWISKYTHLQRFCVFFPFYSCFSGLPESWRVRGGFHCHLNHTLLNDYWARTSPCPNLPIWVSQSATPSGKKDLTEVKVSKATNAHPKTWRGSSSKEKTKTKIYTGKSNTKTETKNDHL